MSPFWEPETNLTIRRRDDAWVEAGQSTQNNRAYLGRSLGRKQIAIVGVFVAIALTTLIGRAFQLQVVEGSYHRDLAEGNRLRAETIIAPRGLLYDQYGRVLTENLPRMSIALIPYDIPRDDEERREVFAAASQVSGIAPERFEEAWQRTPKYRREGFEPVPVEGDLTPEHALKSQLAMREWRGVAVVTTPQRAVASEHGENESLAHVIGYVGRVTEDDLAPRDTPYTSIDIIGKNGLEFMYESLLRGQHGRRDIEVNALGEEQKVFAETSPVPGQHLWLSLDADLQSVAEQALERALQRAQVKRGAVVVMDPRNGAIVSLVTLPTFDANAFNAGLKPEEYQALVNDPDRPLFNRVVQGLYPSGSTIKPIIAAAALAEGVVSANTTFLSTGGIRIGQWFFPDWRGGGHGATDVRKAIAQSVNTYFYIVGGGYQNTVGLGIEKLGKWASIFGLSQRTGIDLPNEADGFFPTPEWKKKAKNESWYIGDTYHVSIGQGDVLVTPLQVANYTAAFANGGTLYEPHMLAEIVSADGKQRTKVEPKIIREQTASPDIIQIIREGMRETVVSGSARSLSLVPIPLAGKTGTAELGGDHTPHAWFTGFGPYESPELSVTVLVEEAGEGSSHAVPVAREIFSWWAENRYDR